MNPISAWGRRATTRPPPDPAAWLRAQRPLAGWAPFLAVALHLAAGILSILLAWLLAQTLDAAIFRGADLAGVAPWLWPLPALFALRALLLWQAERAAFRTAARVRPRLRDRLYRHLLRLPPTRLAEERGGALVETLTRGIDDLEGYYARFLPALTLSMLVPLAVLLAVLPLDWLSALLLALTAPLIPLFMILVAAGTETRNRQQWRALARMGARFLDVIQGLTTLKLFDASRREVETLARLSEAYRIGTMRVLRLAFLSAAVLEFFATLGIALVAVLLGFRLYGAALPVPSWLTLPEVTHAQALFILILAPEFYAPLRKLGAEYHARLAAVAAAERILDLLALAPLATRAGQPLIPARPIGLRFEDVRFAHAGGRDVLHGLSFEVPPGQRIALVGPSGAGKTTVINLLLGFLTPDAGRILVGDQDLARLDLDDWRRHLAWVPQRPRLFRGSLADNIRLGRPEASLAAVRAAARQARIADFIESLPAGYEHQVGEDGTGLSGGQIQRIALARAFLRDAPLVLLDEPTANLDPDSERLVRESLDALARNRTLLVVAHRLATARAADRILVLDDGRLVESGTHASLARAGGCYARLLAAREGRD